MVTPQMSFGYGADVPEQEWPIGGYCVTGMTIAEVMDLTAAPGPNTVMLAIMAPIAKMTKAAKIGMFLLSLSSSLMVPHVVGKRLNRTMVPPCRVPLHRLLRRLLQDGVNEA